MLPVPLTGRTRLPPRHRRAGGAAIRAAFRFLRMRFRPWMAASAAVVGLFGMVATAWAAPEDNVPTELKTLSRVRIVGRHNVPSREIWAVIKTRRPSPWPWRERPRLRLDFLRADTLAIAS